jgi:hypothetical protein
MNPNLKLALGGALVIFAIAFSLIMFPRLNRQMQELQRNATLTPSPAVTATPAR